MVFGPLDDELPEWFPNNRVRRLVLDLVGPPEPYLELDPHEVYIMLSSSRSSPLSASMCFEKELMWEGYIGRRAWTCEWSNGEDADFFGGNCDVELGLKRGDDCAGVKICVFPE
jgi:hypothetical protein